MRRRTSHRTPDKALLTLAAGTAFLAGGILVASIIGSHQLARAVGQALAELAHHNGGL